MEVPAPAPVNGSILLATVDQVQGARARYVILSNLSEGAFPSRDSVEPLLALRAGEQPDAAGRLVFAREMLRFLHVLGSADSGVILAYPTTDLKGQELLRAGFLDDLLERLSEEAKASCHTAYPRLHAALVDQPDLAGAPADLRIRAMALASERGEMSELVRLARDPDHHRVLAGTGAALFAHQHRQRGTSFSEFEGMLGDGHAVLELDRLFGPSYIFSPSQLETYIACPFQFFSKYVLELRPVDERDELDEDYTERGSRIHDILENFETLLKQQSGEGDLEQVAAVQVDRVLGEELSGATDLDLGLWEIERGRLIRAIGQYVLQRRAYERDGEFAFAPYKLELAFGEKGAEHPVLELAHGGSTLRLRGRIDRIDVARTPEGLPVPRDRLQERVGAQLHGSEAGGDAPASALRDRGGAARLREGRDGPVRPRLLEPEERGLQADRVWLVGSGPGDPDGSCPGPGRSAPARGFRGPVAEPGLRELLRLPGCLPGAAGSHGGETSRAEPAGPERPGAAGPEDQRRHEDGAQRRGGVMSEPDTRPTGLTAEQHRALEVRDASVALGAGAGCGKTTVLTERFLAEIDGDDGRALSALVALTFTDKAARELRQRIRARCREKLAAGSDAGRWRLVLRALEAAPIGTFHEFSARLLRAHALDLGIDPEFTILNEAVAASLRDQAIRTAVRRMLAERESDLVNLAIDYGLGQIREALGLLLATRAAGDLDAWIELTPEEIVARWSRVWEAQGRPAVLRVLSSVARCCRELLGRIPTSHPKLQERRAELLERLPALESGACSDEQLSEVRRLARVDDLRDKAIWPEPESKEAVKTVFESLRKAIDQVAKRLSVNPASTLESATNSLSLLRLAARARREYEQIKSRRRGLDFDDLLVRTRDLLGAGPDRDVRSLAAQDAIEFVLVDEFQDTDRVQSEILRLLGGDTFFRGRMFVVGDAQAIDLSVPGRRAGDLRPLAQRVSGAGPSGPDRELPECSRGDPLRQRPLRGLLPGRRRGRSGQRSRGRADRDATRRDGQPGGDLLLGRPTPAARRGP